MEIGRITDVGELNSVCNSENENIYSYVGGKKNSHTPPEKQHIHAIVPSTMLASPGRISFVLFLSLTTTDTDRIHFFLPEVGDE